MAEESPLNNGFTVAATVAVRDLVFTASEFRGTVLRLYDIQAYSSERNSQKPRLTVVIGSSGSYWFPQDL